MNQKKMRRILDWLIPVLCAALVFVLMKTVFLLGYVPSASMEPTLRAKSYVLGLRLYSPLEQGDIIIFRHDEKLLIKRISAIPGDEIKRKDGTSLYVPDGCFYVLGDNSAVSVDSRYWDDPFVKEEDILAVLLLS